MLINAHVQLDGSDCSYLNSLIRQKISKELHVGSSSLPIACTGDELMKTTRQFYTSIEPDIRVAIPRSQYEANPL